MSCWYPQADTDNMGYDDDIEGLVKAWNRCDVCGRFISLLDFETGVATRRMITPDSEYTIEEYETLCPTHAAKSCPHCGNDSPEVWETGLRGSYYICPACHTKYEAEE